MTNLIESIKIGWENLDPINKNMVNMCLIIYIIMTFPLFYSGLRHFIKDIILIINKIRNKK